MNVKKTKNNQEIGRQPGDNAFKISDQKIVDSARDRTWNLGFRRPAPYPLGHRTCSPMGREGEALGFSIAFVFWGRCGMQTI